MNKIIGFDFDGVICDSTEECLITGYNAWLKFQNKSQFITASKQVSEDLAKYFRAWRGLVRTADQYFVVFNSYGKNQKLKNEQDFEQRCIQKKSLQNKYQKLFFAAREELRNKDIEYWSNLHYPYQGIADGLQRIIKIANVFMVTSGKDKPSVKIFLRHLGIDFPEEKIYDKQIAANKRTALEKIAQQTGQKLKDIIFLDDNINHIFNLKQAGCQISMAGWGYHTDEHLTKVAARGIPILDLDNWSDYFMAKLNRNQHD